MGFLQIILASFRKLRVRILLLASLPLLLLTGVLASVYILVGSSSDRLSFVVEQTLPAITTSKEIMADIQSLKSNLWSGILFKDNATLLNEHTAAFERAIDHLSSNFDFYFSLKIEGRALVLRNSADAKWKELTPKLEELRKLFVDKKFEEVKTFASQQVLPKLGEMVEVLGTIDVNNSDLIELEQKHSQKMAKNASIARWVMISGTLSAIIISLLLSLFLSGRIAATLRDFCSRLSQEAEVAKSKSTTLASAAQNLSKSSESAASAIQETASAIEQLKATIGLNSEFAQSSTLATEKSVDLVAKNKALMDQIKSSIDGIRSVQHTTMGVVNDSTQTLKDIISVIAEIDEKAQVINDIVLQTKLLSFNANVEAARSGEHGKGFSVVASEIGVLAASSGKAAEEIKNLLSKSSNKVESIIKETTEKMTSAVTDVNARVEKTQQAVEFCVGQLDFIVTESQGVNKQVSKISQSSKEQLSSAAEIGASMGVLENIATENVNTGQGIDRTTSDLVRQAQVLEGIIFDMDTMISGQVSPKNAA